MSLDDLARASCAVYCDGHRDGTGTLVTDSHVLTAAHVLRRGGALAIRFRDGLYGEPIPVERLSLAAGAEQLDIAVLELGRSVAEPPPAKLWPARRLPPETKAFGYPVEEGAQPQGVWLDSRIGGTVQGGRAQLDWDDVGALTGHSGGPVCDKRSGLMAGVLVEGSTAGHFDRMVTLAAVRTVWDGLPRPWLFAGENAWMHFTQRAAGQQSIASGGDLFRGRREALAAVRDWFCADARPGIPLAITARPGGGKSAVLGRAVLKMESAGQCDGVAFHARGATVADLVDAVSAACGLDTPSSWQELVATLATGASDDVLVVAVDALDEAKGERDIADLRQVLRDLARLGWLRVAVATRPLATRDIYGPGTHLYGLGVVRGTAVTWSIWTSAGSSPLTISSLTPTPCWPRTGLPIRSPRAGAGRPTGRTKICAHGSPNWWRAVPTAITLSPECPRSSSPKTTGSSTPRPRCSTRRLFPAASAKH